jgi:glycosyltransferase involved in cell wall biosynthesis
MSGHNVVFNGKFLSAAPTGVHRVAHELISNMDALLAERPDLAAERRWGLVKPRDAHRSMDLNVIRQRTAGITTWQPWEQFELPFLARGSTLVSLCNLAPISRTGGITMIHDAQVFLSPESYSLAFRQWYRFALPRIGKSSKLVLTVSNYSRDTLVEFGVAPREKIEVIHNGVDHLGGVPPDREVISRLGLTPGGYAVALANRQKHKNIPILLEAFARPAMSDIPLVLVGKSSAGDFIQIGASPSPNVLFPGAVSDAEMRALFEQAGCLAFPSTTEGFGLPPLEAMALGCPAIVAPCGALPEVCGEAAIYVAPYDAPAWESAILSLLGSPSERSRRADMGRVQAAQFTWRKSAEKLLVLTRQVADG